MEKLNGCYLCLDIDKIDECLFLLGMVEGYICQKSDTEWLLSPRAGKAKLNFLNVKMLYSALLPNTG